MALIAWIVGMLLLTQLFGAWEAKQRNPNSTPQSYSDVSKTEVILKKNRSGHYKVTGRINQRAAHFMVDTGATDVVIPSSLANDYQLSAYGQGLGLTANGYVELERTYLNELSIGDITLYNVRASLNPGMKADQPILLGMTALSQLELKQHQGTLTLTQHRY